MPPPTKVIYSKRLPKAPLFRLFFFLGVYHFHSRQHMSNQSAKQTFFATGWISFGVRKFSSFCIVRLTESLGSSWITVKAMRLHFFWSKSSGTPMNFECLRTLLWEKCPGKTMPTSRQPSMWRCEMDQGRTHGCNPWRDMCWSPSPRQSSPICSVCAWMMFVVFLCISVDWTWVPAILHLDVEMDTSDVSGVYIHREAVLSLGTGGFVGSWARSKAIPAECFHAKFEWGSSSTSRWCRPFLTLEDHCTHTYTHTCEHT